MEYHQQVQQRTAQTVPVVTKYAPDTKIQQKGVVELQADSTALNTLAQTRDDAIFASDEAVRAEYAAFLQIRLLTLKIPALIEALLDEDDPLLDSLAAVYAITPRTTEAALSRARVLRPVWVKANAVLAAKTPAEGPIQRNGQSLTEFDALLAAHPALEQAVNNKAQDVKDARTALKLAAVALDKLNKRFYKALAALADDGSAFAAALAQIETESANAPDTLSIATVLQGGSDQLHVLVNYDPATFDDSLENTLEWQVQGVDAAFAHTVKADPSGNAVGPFAVGQTVQVRTRASNAGGTTTSAVRTITITAPIS